MNRRLYSRIRPVFAAFIAVIALILTPGTDARAQQAHARIIDGRTISQQGKTYHLRHITVPAPGTRCRRGGTELDCGAIARAQLIDISIGATIICTRTARGDQCRADNFDLSHGMVHAGWARARHPSLIAIEAAARQQQRGLWHPDWQPPAQWRN